MLVQRREFVTAIALGGAIVTDAGQAAVPEKTGKIVHHVFFWLKRPGSLEDRETLIAGLRSLADIPVIRKLEIGVPASTERREVVDASFDVSELMVFDGIADQKVYQDHAIHRDFIDRLCHLWEKV